MERLYNFFMLKYYKVHPSVKLKPIYPTLNVCPGKLTKFQKRQHNSLSKHKSSTTNPRDSLIVSQKVSDSIELPTELSVEDIELIHGNLEVKILNVKLSEACIQQLAKTYGKNCTIFFKWKFHDQPRTTTPYETIGKIQGFINNFSVKYKVVLNGGFYKFLVNRHLPVELYACNNYKEDIIGVGLFSLEHCLDNVGKTTVNTLIIDDRHDQIVFAQLSIATRLDADNDYVQTCKTKYKEAGYKDKVQSLNNDFFITKQNYEDDVIAIQDTLNNVLIRSNYLKIARCDINEELKERVEYLHQECNWKRTLQEHAILKGEDPFSIKDHQWRTEETNKIKLRTFSPSLKIKNCEFIVTIKSVKLNANSYIIRDDHIKRIYVEYEFLNRKGPAFETPNSVKKSELITFDFKKTFPFHMVYNSCDCKLLAEFIKTEKNISFSIVGEPEFKPQIPTMTCMKLAFCRISLLDLVESLEDEVLWKCELTNSRNESEIVGTLSVLFQGLLSLRKTALKLLAPPEYDLI